MAIAAFVCHSDILVNVYLFQLRWDGFEEDGWNEVEDGERDVELI